MLAILTASPASAQDAPNEAPAATKQHPAATPPAGQPLAAATLATHAASGRFRVVADDSSVVLLRVTGEHSPENTISEKDFITAVSDTARTADDLTAIWEAVAASPTQATPTLDMLKALVTASNTAKGREPLWSELAWRAKLLANKPRGTDLSKEPERAFIALFEQHRAALLPLLTPLRETEGGGDEMVHVMLHTRVFGKDFETGLAYLLQRNPGAIARLIERERERGRPVKWEWDAFEGMMRWKMARLAGGANRPPQPFDVLDANGEMYITMFNSLHSLDEWYRSQMLKGIGPIDVFNAAVGGEQELYRLGTSGYRNFLHPMILRGIKESGSFEAFLQRATARGITDGLPGIASRRGLVFMRIASSFGLLETVLETILDRERFAAEAIQSLGDPTTFESTSTIVVDLITTKSGSPASVAFKRMLLDQLYVTYGAASTTSERSVYGSMLSAYQTVSGDHRDKQIDADFPLDASLQRMPFSRLFDTEGKGNHIHRIFMRMDEDLDAISTFGSFRTMMRQMGASTREERNHVVFRLSGRKRAVDIFVNKPNTAGIRLGIGEIASALRGARIHTVIGRGHTGIITPLQRDSRRVLGDRIREVTMVIVGACGGDASVRELINTFGYVPFLGTKSTGRQVINNEIIETYIGKLLSLEQAQHLAMTEVLDQAVAQVLKSKVDDEMREDTQLYQVNLTTVFAARLFDKHVRGLSSLPLPPMAPERRYPDVVVEAPEPAPRPRPATRSTEKATKSAESPTPVTGKRVYDFTLER
jgi:uncharacterized protein YqgQ